MEDSAHENTPANRFSIDLLLSYHRQLVKYPASGENDAYASRYQIARAFNNQRC